MNGPAQTLQEAGVIASDRLGKRGKGGLGKREEGGLDLLLPYNARVLTVLSFSFRQRVIS